MDDELYPKWLRDVLFAQGKKHWGEKVYNILEKAKGNMDKKAAQYLYTKGVDVVEDGDDYCIKFKGKILHPSLNEYQKQLNQ